MRVGDRDRDGKKDGESRVEHVPGYGDGDLRGIVGCGACHHCQCNDGVGGKGWRRGMTGDMGREDSWIIAFFHVMKVSRLPPRPKTSKAPFSCFSSFAIIHKANSAQRSAIPRVPVGNI